MQVAWKPSDTYHLNQMERNELVRIILEYLLKYLVSMYSHGLLGILIGREWISE